MKKLQFFKVKMCNKWIK